MESAGARNGTVAQVSRREPAARAWPWLAAVLVVAGLLLLLDLGSGEFRPWDEGLYGRLSRNALEHDVYLYAVGEDGEYFRRFSKPPLTLWMTAASFKLLGPSVAALRLPFALGMMAAIGAAFAWGHRIGGISMAVAWSLALTASTGALRWGRHACIEPLFGAAMMFALWAYHTSMIREGAAARRWAIGCGVAFTVAVMTKQLAVGLGVLPIVALELWRRDRASLPRLAWALGIPAAVGLGWFLAAGEATDGAVFDVLLDRGVRRRLAGFPSGQNARTLNELTTVLEQVAAPLSWPLGVVGLALLSVARPKAELRKPGPTLLLPLSFLSAVVVLENASSSMLPWYAFHLLVPVTGGLAWCVAAAATRPNPGRIAAARVVLGWSAVAAASLTAAAAFASQLNTAVVAATLFVAAVVLGGSSLRIAALVGAGLAMLGSQIRHPELNPPDPPFNALMPLLADQTAVAVDRNTGLVELAYRTLFGPHTTMVKRAPWPTRDYTSYVSAVVLPEEFEPPADVIVHRTAGATAFVGNLDQRVWGRQQLDALLDAGPITYEAERLGATDWQTTFDDPDASGGRLRRYGLFRNEQPPRRALSVGPKLPLAKGHYALEVWLNWSCPEERSERDAVAVSIKGESRRVLSRSLACEDAPGELAPQRFEFALTERDTVNLRVGFRYGVVEHDKTVLRRLD